VAAPPLCPQSEDDDDAQDAPGKKRRRTTDAGPRPTRVTSVTYSYSQGQNVPSQAPRFRSYQPDQPISQNDGYHVQSQGQDVPSLAPLLRAYQPDHPTAQDNGYHVQGDMPGANLFDHPTTGPTGQAPLRSVPAYSQAVEGGTARPMYPPLPSSESTLQTQRTSTQGFQSQTVHPRGVLRADPVHSTQKPAIDPRLMEVDVAPHLSHAKDQPLDDCGDGGDDMNNLFDFNAFL
jgi:hypothetical protein